MYEVGIKIVNLKFETAHLAVFREVLNFKGLESVKAVPIEIEIDDSVVTEQVECTENELHILEDVLSSLFGYEKEVIV